MDNIINFPTKMVRDKISFEKTIRSRLSDLEIPTIEIEPLIERLLPIWEAHQHQFQLSFTLPSSIDTKEAEIIKSSFNSSLEAFQRRLYDFNSTLLLDRINVEIKLFRLEHYI